MVVISHIRDHHHHRHQKVIWCWNATSPVLLITTSNQTEQLCRLIRCHQHHHHHQHDQGHRHHHHHTWWLSSINYIVMRCYDRTQLFIWKTNDTVALKQTINEVFWRIRQWLVKTKLKVHPPTVLTRSILLLLNKDKIFWVLEVSEVLNGVWKDQTMIASESSQKSCN